MTGAGRLVTAAYSRGARHLFRPAAVAGQILLALAGLAAVLAAVTSGQHFVLRVRPAQIPVVIGLSLAAVTVHELAHALVVIRHGRAVDAAGIRLHLGTPAFYVESASAVLLTRRQRLIQAAAGVWAEWQFTSLVAIWLWLSPLPFAVPLLHRFVILNAATIATNLLPFTGLDGSWLLADAASVPDLTRRSRGAVTRLLTSLTTRQPFTPADKALAAYSAANGLAAIALLATAGFFWYQLFGDLAATLTRHGPAGWALLIAAAILLGRPAATAAPSGYPPPPRPAASWPPPLSSGCSGGGASPPPASLPAYYPPWPASAPPSSASSPDTCAAPAITAGCPPPSPAATESSAPEPSPSPPPAAQRTSPPEPPGTQPISRVAPRAAPSSSTSMPPPSASSLTSATSGLRWDCKLTV